MDTPTWQTPGAIFEVTMSWKLLADIRLWAVFTLEVLEVQPTMMRLSTRIKNLVSLRSSVPPEDIEPEWIERVRALEGRYILVPYEAATGTPLYLRLQTLTGEHGYFAAAPRAGHGTARHDP